MVSVVNQIKDFVRITALATGTTLLAGCSSLAPGPGSASGVVAASTSASEDTIAPVRTSFAGTPSQRHWTAYFGTESRFALAALSQKVLSRLLAENGLAANTATIGVYACDNPGAATWIPERSIAVCRSTVQKLETEDGLAFLVAHELSHILLDHCPGGNESCLREQLQNRADVRGWVGAGAFVASVLTMGGAGILVAAGAGLLENGISAPLDKASVTNLDRADEEAADRLALKLVAGAGYSPLDARTILTSLTGGSDVVGHSAVAPDATLLANSQTGGAFFTMDLLKEITESMANRNLHPTGAYRIDKVSDLIGRYYRAEAGVEPTAIALGSDLKTYQNIAGPGRLADGNLALSMAFSMLQANEEAAAIAALDRIVASGSANTRTYLGLALMRGARGYINGQRDSSAVTLALEAYRRSGGIRFKGINGDYMDWARVFMALGDYGTANDIMDDECRSSNCSEIKSIMRNISDDDIAAYQNEPFGRAVVLLSMYVPSF